MTRCPSPPLFLLAAILAGAGSSCAASGVDFDRALFEERRIAVIPEGARVDHLEFSPEGHAAYLAQ